MHERMSRNENGLMPSKNGGKCGTELAQCMVRECVYRGFGPEMNGCGSTKRTLTRRYWQCIGMISRISIARDWEITHNGSLFLLRKITKRSCME